MNKLNGKKNFLTVSTHHPTTIPPQHLRFSGIKSKLVALLVDQIFVANDTIIVFLVTINFHQKVVIIRQLN